MRLELSNSGKNIALKVEIGKIKYKRLNLFRKINKLNNIFPLFVFVFAPKKIVDIFLNFNFFGATTLKPPKQI